MRPESHLGLVLALALLWGCDDYSMRDGGRFKPYEPSEFLEGSVSQPLPAHVVAQGDAAQPLTPITTGRDADGWVQRSPLRADESLLRRGQTVYGVFCINCHGPAGYGDGMIVQRGHPAPPSFHTQRLRDVPDGHLFNVVSEGYGKMQPFGSLISPTDRWAAIAYLRVLQQSQFMRVEDLPPEIRRKLESEPGP